MNRWIKVEEALPEGDKRVLADAHINDINMFFAKYKKSSNKWYREPNDLGLEQHVTHWMPLPDPPGKYN